MNKLIVVTGGTKGIGRAVTEKFAANGFDIATCSRSAADLESLKSDLKKSFGVEVFTYKANLAKKDEADAFCDHLNALKRPIHVLVNNAGYFIPGEIATEPDGTLENMINANLYSAYHMTRGIIKGMMEKREGYIFNMCSIASIKAYPNGGSYAVSKFALLGLSKCLREEVKSFGIRVTAIMPGATLTDSWAGSGLPDERFMKSGDIADTIFSCYQLSNRSVVEEIIIRPQLGDI